MKKLIFTLLFISSFNVLADVSTVGISKADFTVFHTNQTDKSIQKYFKAISNGMNVFLVMEADDGTFYCTVNSSYIKQITHQSITFADGEVFTFSRAEISIGDFKDGYKQLAKNHLMSISNKKEDNDPLHIITNNYYEVLYKKVFKEINMNSIHSFY